MEQIVSAIKTAISGRRVELDMQQRCLTDCTPHGIIVTPEHRVQVMYSPQDTIAGEEVVDGSTLNVSARDPPSSSATDTDSERVAAAVEMLTGMAAVTSQSSPKDMKSTPTAVKQKHKLEETSSRSNRKAGVASNKSHQCKICRRKFVAKAQLKSHMFSHSTSRPYQCTQCDRTYKHPKYLREHMKKGRHESKETSSGSNFGEVLPSDKPHQCQICGRRFGTNKQLTSHMFSHSNSRPYQCNQCGQSYKHPAYLRQHMKKGKHESKGTLNWSNFEEVLASDKSHQCRICRRNFGTKAQLKSHLFSHSTSRPFQCNQCDCSYKHPKYLREHMKKGIHKSKETSSRCTSEGEASDESHQCQICARKFRTKVLLKSHMFSHRTSRPFQCNQCNRSYKHPKYLRDHKKSHGSFLYKCRYCERRFYLNNLRIIHENYHITPYKCSTCKKGFGNKQSLEVHMRTHTNDRPFVCSTCKSSFTSKGTLLKHERSHSGLKPHTCDVCGKSFTTLTFFKDHKKTHADINTFACKTCGKVYHARASLRRHRLKRHPDEKDPIGGKHLVKIDTPIRANPNKDPYQCKFCHKSYQKRASHRKHEKLHTAPKFSCQECHKVFAGRHELAVHERSHTGERPFICDVCGKAYSYQSALQRHRKSHSQSKPYECTVCQKSFTRLTGLRDHKLIHSGQNKRFSCHVCGESFASRVGLRNHSTKNHSSGNPMSVGSHVSVH